MNLRILFILTALTGTVFSEPIAIEWDPHPDENVAGFILHIGKAPGQYGSTVRIEGGEATTYLIAGLPPATYFAALSAYNEAGLESGLSNEITFAYDPDPPANLRLSVQASRNLDDWTEIASIVVDGEEVRFYRLKIIENAEP